ncbi:MAG TPA: hypothetical protein DIT55_07285, partial [Spirochaetaceae bacterium]|nr:hypothetical protein [Spirochaetaceae bacterium]
WAENNEIKADYPKEYGEAAAAMDGAEISYDNQRYAPAKTLAEEVSTTLSDDFQKKVLADRAAKIEAATQPASTPAPTPQQQASKDQAADAARAKADAAMADAQSRMAWANENGISSDYPGEYKKASAAMVDSFVSYGNGQYNTATAWAKEVSTILSDDFQAKVLADRQAAAKAAEAEQARIVAAALADIDNAQARYDWAVSENAENNYPELLGKGGSELEAAKAALSAEDYKGASDKARAALVSLSGIKAFAPLPEKYVVRLIPARRDCLWRIAEYDFIYNNPLKWPVLYEANKKTFKDPSNPDLIFPNQVLVIPSIKGETRSGTWDPKKTYNPLPKK